MRSFRRWSGTYYSVLPKPRSISYENRTTPPRGPGRSAGRGRPSQAVAWLVGLEGGEEGDALDLAALGVEQADGPVGARRHVRRRHRRRDRVPPVDRLRLLHRAILPQDL